MSDLFSQRLLSARTIATQRLLSELNPEGHWSGELSSSALSTATAITALATVDRTSSTHAPLIANGLRWLARYANPDGGWGDTPRSRSNLSTTALVWAAFGAAQADTSYPDTLAHATRYLTQTAGSIDRLVPAIEALYGKDRTFSVPITMMLALSGRLGPNGWKRVRPLPFELAVFPRSLFGALRLPVVSYALPALIAIGQVIHHRSQRFHPLRSLAQKRTLDVLSQLQPSNGGFLEATPLTSFVTMSLAGMDLALHPVAQRGADFLRNSARPDGSWPIDTHLATWVSTLAIKALSHSPDSLDPPQKSTLRSWLLHQQGAVTHPYTGAAPGAWAWTPLPGGVPDADDTAGALLALHLLGEPDFDTLVSASAGVHWLLNLQNRDGGIPTFCRGWGTLPFDRSTPELTAHALRAWNAWTPHLHEVQVRRIRSATRRALHFLQKSQQPNGSWIPLWFGNESAPRQENPVYGTAQVLIALQPFAVSSDPAVQSMTQKAAHFLQSAQNADGGWGGDGSVDSTVEETAWAVAAGTTCPELQSAARTGAEWLLQRIENGTWTHPSPIGLYFARLWYFERLYPILATVEALNRLSPAPAPPPSKPAS